MHESITHPDDLMPGNLFGLVSRRIGNVVCRFTDNLNRTFQGQSQHRIGIQIVA